MRLRSWASYLLVAATTLSCGSLQEESAGSRAGVTKPVSQLAVVYVVPGQGRQDGAVYLHLTDAAGRALRPDSSVGGFTRVQQVASNLSSAPVRSVLVAQKIDGTTTTIDVDTSTTTPSTIEATMPAGAIDATGSLFLIRRGGVAQVDANGLQLGSFALQPPLMGQRTVDGNPTTSIVDPATARVGYVARAADGHVYATVDNSVNSAVLDLTANRRLDLPGIGYVEGGVSVGAALYLVLWDPSKTGSHFAVARIPTSTFSVASKADLSINPWAGVIDSAEIVASNDTTIVVYTSQGTPSGAHRSVVTRVDVSSLASTDVTLPGNSGLHAVVGVDGSLYVFGGVAKNAVTRVDTTTWQASAVAFVDPVPSASYVVAVFAR